MTDPGAALTVEAAEVTFPDADRPALAGVDLDVASGELVALLGPSGCGKTTLLRVVAGLLAPDAGRVLLDGTDLNAVPAHRRGVGLMFQDYALFPHRDVGGNVEFGLRMAGTAGPERRARVAEVLELVGLPGWERRPVGPLSGGERQRVALARALAPAPRLLLLDEPLGALDRTLRDRLIPELGELFRHLGLTVVHVTHDQSEAFALADRVVVMDHGTVARDATPSDLWSRPGTVGVARFLGFTNVVESPSGHVLVRPEAVVLHEATGPEGSDLTDVVAPDATAPVGGPPVGDPPVGGPGQVAAVLFRGDHSVVRVRRRDGSELDAVVATASGRRWTVGDHVSVEIRPDGVQPLDDDARSPDDSGGTRPGELA